MTCINEIDPVSLNQWFVISSVREAKANTVLTTRLMEASIGYAISTDGSSAAVWRSRPDLRDGDSINPADVTNTLPSQLAYGYLWTSLGTPERNIFDIPEYFESDRRCVGAGAVGVHVSAPRAIENFLDMGHFPFVHTDILGAEPHTEVKEYRVDMDVERDEIVATECLFYQPKSSSAANTGSDIEYVYRIPHPFCAVLHKSLGRRDGRMTVVALFLQPLDQERIRAHMLGCLLDDVTEEKAIRRFQQTVFGQDKPILENQFPKRLPLDPRSETPIRADKLAIAYRRWLSQKGVAYGTIPMAQ